MRMNRKWAAIAAASFASIAIAPLAFAQAKKPDVRIATGTPGGAYYAMGAVLADVLTRSGRVNTATAEASSGAIESARLMVSGEISIGGMDANWVVAGLKGEAPYLRQCAWLAGRRITQFVFIRRRHLKCLAKCAKCHKQK